MEGGRINLNILVMWLMPTIHFIDRMHPYYSNKLVLIIPTPESSMRLSVGI